VTIPTILPTYTTPAGLISELREHGYAALSPDSVLALTSSDAAEFAELATSWDDLPPDNFLKDGGRYRRRRHASFILEDATLRQVPHRVHYQPVAYNALHGGMLRMFEPIQTPVIQHDVWQQLLLAIGKVCTAVSQTQTWFIEAHQFRIDTTDGIGRPTPEGAHRDGVDFVAILVVARVNVKGGESRVFDFDGPNGKRFTLLQPWTLLIVDDQRVIHETTPIQPTEPDGHRDTLVLTYRSNGFLQSESQD
jgi:hypothetical protein